VAAVLLLLTGAIVQGPNAGWSIALLLTVRLSAAAWRRRAMRSGVGRGSGVEEQNCDTRLVRSGYLHPDGATRWVGGRSGDAHTPVHNETSIRHPGAARVHRWL